MLSAITGGRSRLHLVVLGHVDAGKSTLMGRLLADLGVVTQKQVHCPAKLLHVGNEPWDTCFASFISCMRCPRALATQPADVPPDSLRQGAAVSARRAIS